MPHSLYLMLTWTTYERLPMIRAPEASFLSRFLPAEAQRHHMTVLALGMVVDHVHLVLRAPPVMNISQLVQHLKGGSSRVANQTIDGPGLRWAAGYSVQSVSPDALSRTIHYVRAQHLRHPDRLIPDLDPNLGACGDGS